MDSTIVGLLLVFCLVGMYVLAMLYLRRRALSFGRYAMWGLFALLLPAVGPFLVLLIRPGKVLQSNNRRKT